METNNISNRHWEDPGTTPSRYMAQVLIRSNRSSPFLAHFNLLAIVAEYLFDAHHWYDLDSQWMNWISSIHVLKCEIHRRIEQTILDAASVKYEHRSQWHGNLVKQIGLQSPACVPREFIDRTDIRRVIDNFLTCPLPIKRLQITIVLQERDKQKLRHILEIWRVGGGRLQNYEKWDKMSCSMQSVMTLDLPDHTITKHVLDMAGWAMGNKCPYLFQATISIPFSIEENQWESIRTIIINHDLEYVDENTCILLWHNRSPQCIKHIQMGSVIVGYDPHSKSFRAQVVVAIKRARLQELHDMVFDGDRQLCCFPWTAFWGIDGVVRYKDQLKTDASIPNVCYSSKSPDTPTQALFLESKAAAWSRSVVFIRTWPDNLFVANHLVIQGYGPRFPQTVL